MTTMLFARDGSGMLQKKQDQKKLGPLLKRFAPLNFALETGRKVPRGGDPPIEVSGGYTNERKALSLKGNHSLKEQKDST